MRVLLVLLIPSLYPALGAMPMKGQAPQPQVALQAELSEIGAASGFLVVHDQLALDEVRGRAVDFRLTETSSPPPCTGRVCPMVASSMSVRTFTIQPRRGFDFRAPGYVAAEAGSGATLVVAASRDLGQPRWRVTLTEANGKKRALTGNPVSPSDLQACLSHLTSLVCMDLYLPAQCTVHSLEGNAIAPVTASGSNPCFATSALQGVLCAYGYDPSRLTETDYTCAVTAIAPCPIPECAAPPAGCHYGAPNPVDAKGCAIGCGNVVCDQAP